MTIKLNAHAHMHRYKHHGSKVRERFDFVEEWAELWVWNEQRNPCRPVIQLRGFVSVCFASTGAGDQEAYNIAIARNLVPHAASSICAQGNPCAPKWCVLHCLWEFQRPVTQTVLPPYVATRMHSCCHCYIVVNRRLYINIIDIY